MLKLTSATFTDRLIALRTIQAQVEHQKETKLLVFVSDLLYLSSGEHVSVYKWAAAKLQIKKLWIRMFENIEEKHLELKIIKKL